MKHICGGIEYWLIYATYWGCCNGQEEDYDHGAIQKNIIRDLRVRMVKIERSLQSYSNLSGMIVIAGR